MPFTSISLPSMGSWPSKTKSSPARSRQTSVDLTKKVSEDFGIPQVDDPDPFGVLALQRAGLLIKEAGTKSRPTSDTFEFRPSPSSPVFRHSSTFSEGANRLSRRGSKRSIASNDIGIQTADSAGAETQHIDAAYLSPTQLASATIPSPVFERTQAEAMHINTSKRNSHDGNTSPVSPHTGAIRSSPLRQSLTPEPEGKSDELVAEASKAAAKAATDAERKRLRSMSASQRLAESLDKLERSLPNSAAASPSGSASPEEEDSDPEVIVETVVTAPVQTVRVMTPKAVASPTAVRAKLVTIKGKPAPAIPARNPRRHRARAAQGENGGDHLSIDQQDESSSAYSLSPTRSAFDRNDDRASIPWSEQTSIPDMDRASAKSLRGTPEPSENADASIGPQNGDKGLSDQKPASGTTKQSTPVYGLGIDGMSDTSTTEARTEVTYMPSAAAHSSPTRLAHLEVPEDQARGTGDETPTAPLPTDPLDESSSANAQAKNNPSTDAVSISDTQSHYADDEADDVSAKPTGAKDSNAEDDDSDAFHSIPATPLRNVSPLHREMGPSPLKTTIA